MPSIRQYSVSSEGLICTVSSHTLKSHSQVKLSVSRGHNRPSDWPMSLLFTEWPCETFSVRVCDQAFTFCSVTALSHHLLSGRLIPLIERHQCCCQLSVLVLCFRPTCQLSDCNKHLMYCTCNTCQTTMQWDHALLLLCRRFYLEMFLEI